MTNLLGVTEKRFGRDDKFVPKKGIAMPALPGLTPNKLVIPTGAYPNSCHIAPDMSACAVFFEEDRMKFAKATDLDRNSGERSGGTCFFFPFR